MLVVLEISEVLMLEWVTIINVAENKSKNFIFLVIINAEKPRVSL